MMKLVTLVFALCTFGLLAQPSPLNHNRWTTNADATIVSGSTLTNVPQAAVTGLTGAYQPASTALTNFDALGTNAFLNRADNYQVGSSTLTNFSTLSTNLFVNTNTFVTFTNTLRSAAFTLLSDYQPTNGNTTLWSQHLTNDFYPTNFNLQAGSTVLSNFVNLGTNAWIPFGTSLVKGMHPVYNGTNWVRQSPPAGTSILTYNVSGPSGQTWVSVVDPANLGTGSSLSSAILYRDGIWRVPSTTTNGTNISIFVPSQFSTNVDGQVTIKNGASVTNLQAYGTTATAILNATSFTSGSITSVTLVVDTINPVDTAITFSSGNAAIYADGSISLDNGIITTDGAGDLTVSNLVATDVDSASGNISSLFADSLTTGANLVVGDALSGNGATNFVQTMIHGSGVTTNGNGTLTINGGGGSSSLATSNVLYVAKNGSDVTGTSNRLDLPFLTIGKAKTNAHQGDLIYIYPGVYNESNLLTNGVNYYLSAGVTVTNGSTTMFDDLNLPSTNIISGYGKFVSDSGCVLSVSNSLSRIKFSGSEVVGNTQASGVNRLGLFSISDCTRVDVDVPEINGNDATAVYWRIGDTHVKANSITGSYAVWGEDFGSNTANIYVTADYVASTGSGAAILISSPSTSYRAWFDAKYIENMAGTTIIITGSPKVYIQNAMKIAGVDSIVQMTDGNQYLWLDAQKITADVDIESGVADVHVNEIESGKVHVANSGTLRLCDTKITHTNENVLFQGGSLLMNKCNLNGRVTVQDTGMIMDGCSIKSLVEVPVQLFASGLVLRYTTILTDGVIESISSPSEDPFSFSNTYSASNATTNGSVTTLSMPLHIDADVK